LSRTYETEHLSLPPKLWPVGNSRNDKGQFSWSRLIGAGLFPVLLIDMSFIFGWFWQ